MRKTMASAIPTVTFLYVDDSFEQRMEVQEQIEAFNKTASSWSYRCEMCNGGESACETMADRGERYSLIVLDWPNPSIISPRSRNVDVALIKKIAQISSAQLKDPLLVVVSSELDESIKRSCIEAGVHEYVVAPIASRLTALNEIVSKNALRMFKK
jgi:CheY-like chemotaxis protein